jgi:hypothetical protein
MQEKYFKKQNSKIYNKLTISILLSIDCQLSLISYVVLQLFPTSLAHKAGVSIPHSIIQIISDA